MAPPEGRPIAGYSNYSDYNDYKSRTHIRIGLDGYAFSGSMLTINMW